MVAYEAQRRSGSVARELDLRDISTMITEVHGVRVFDTWSDDDLDMSIDQVVYAPAAARPPRRRGGWLGSIVMMMVGGLFGMGIVGAALLALFAVGLVATGALIYTVPMVDVVMPAKAPNAALPQTDDADADLVVMPDPGFRKPEPKKK